MQTVVEKINSYSRLLKVSITPEDLIPIEEKIIKNFQRRADIPGFRPGKAPVSIIRQRHKDLIQQEMMEEAIRKFYGKALNESAITPVSEGKITNFTFDNIQSGMQFEMEVEIEPEFEIKKYKGLKIDKDVVELNDEMVERALEDLREQFATVTEVEEAQQGHYVHFDVQELDKGDVPIVGHKYENLQAELGSGKFDLDIEKQLTGIRKGDKRIIRKEILPEPGKSDQQRVSSLEVSVKKIEEKEFPELNDDFVKNLNEENLQNLEQLRERIRHNMRLDFNHRSENIFQRRLVDELLKENPFEVPPGMVENYLNELIKDIQKQSKNKNINEESLRKEYRVSAIHNLRWHFLKKKLIEMEGITISDEEIHQLIEQSDLDEKVKKQARADQHYLGHLKDDLLERKIIDMLKKHAEVTEVFPMRQKSV